jgi:hydroxymethylglutaryl-CoA lyase
MPHIDIVISEVGPRDGLQSIKTIMQLEAKKAWILAEAAAGVPEIEVGSFVPAKILPQMADTAVLVAYARKIEGLCVAALVPNFRGAEDAIRAGAHKISIPLSVSETHSLKNVKRTHDQMIDEVLKIATYIKSLPYQARPFFEGSLSTAFGCTMEGPVAEDKVVELAARLMKAGCDEVGLSDTTGYATPRHLTRLIKAVKAEIGDDKLKGLHLHNTRGVGLANVYAALEVGITTLDASLGGLGGCPFAPGASGNIVTEDLVYMLDAMGLKTGIDLEKLFAVRQIVQEALPDEELFGFTPHAGLPKGYQQI